MRVAVIGPGKIGATVAMGLARAGHTIVIAGSRPLVDLEALANKLGLAGSGSTSECVARSEAVLLSLPFGCHVALPVDPFAGRVVVNAMNYWTARDGANEQLESRDVTSSELVQQRLSGSKLVKSLNTMKWEMLRDGGRRRGHPERLIVPVSGDDAEAVSVAAELVDDLGFDCVNVGSLREGGLLQQPEGRLHGVLVTSSTWRSSDLSKICG